ncbi:MAG: ferrous iron transporter B [Planctomycetota bacterium]|nr:ferrous iron transporter B [Planctomycetota bacterium]
MRPASSPEPSAAAVDDGSPTADTPRRIVLLGNPNTGKTSLFNRLCGVRHKTSNFPGTTQEARVGSPRDLPPGSEVIDLPGIYSLELEQSEAEICRRVLAGELAPRGEDNREPDAVLVVADATNMPRSLMLVGEATRRGLPMVVAINQVDLSRRRGIHADEHVLAERLGIEVIPCSARTGEGLEHLAPALEAARIPRESPPGSEDGLCDWADELYAEMAAGTEPILPDTLTDRLDNAFTHPVLGLVAFVAIMTGLFWVIFKLAAYPMGWIEIIFSVLGSAVGSVLPAGPLHDLLAEGVVTGVGSTVIFLPQICVLFFLISILEDTGYLARAAFVMDKALRPFGLTGHAFVPFLSSHACALPGIISARAVPDRRDRLATILAAPFMSCTARIPVYVLLTVLLFPQRPALQALAFTGCYVLGVVAGLASAMIARRTILPGKSRPMVLELPAYKLPSLRNAALTAWDSGVMFLRKAGTAILAICIVLWWLGAYPHVDPPQQSLDLRAQAAAIAQVEVAALDETDLEGEAAELVASAAAAESRHGQRYSFLGRMGSTLEPVFRPLGYDRQLTIGVIASFAAREVFVSTMAVQVVGVDDVEADGVLDAIANATRDDGVTRVFTPATNWSLLIYYVLAMQCLPTLAVTAKEAGSWKWAALQLGWMSGIAYVAATMLYQTLRALGMT